ncbi:DsbA family protein [Kribbella speibonae]|uniref:DsbA family protein n=1 Tax=Kribbella speibonae TaxID=1572660 RepID=A0A4R0IXH7_9ACTN|nr:thioredoxin domain-containing protein [Kribbella speibonae]TCC36376.1 DsbA family protein [Kribbella speibonae]
MHRREVQAALQQERKRQARRAWIARGIGSTIMLGLLAAMAVAVIHAARTPQSTASAEIVAPKGVTSDGAIPVGDPGAPVRVTVYFDYMCPACGAFEKANGASLKALAAAGKARLELRPLRFLDPTSLGTAYSTRAANALATVAADSPSNLWAFHSALYAHQPQENSHGLTDAEIARYGEDAGVPSSVTSKFVDGRYAGWIRKMSDAALPTVESTPTVLINGSEFDGSLMIAGPLTEAIEAAVGRSK